MGARRTIRAASGPAESRARLILRRAAITVTGFWLVGLSLAVALNRQAVVVPWLAVGLIAVAAALWLVWVLGLLPDGGFLVGLTLVGWFQILNTDHNAGLPLIPFTALSAVAMAIGLLSMPRSSRWVLILAAATSCVYVAVLWASLPPLAAWADALMSLTHLVVNGMVAIAVATILTRAARIGDEAATARQTQQALVANNAAQRADLLHVARTVHDTVINTLSLLRRGISEEQRQPLSARCRNDLASIDTMLDSPPPASLASPDTAGVSDPVGVAETASLSDPPGVADLARVADPPGLSNTGGAPDKGGVSIVEATREVVAKRAAEFGLTISLQVDDSIPAMPTRAVSAACATVGEALTNAAKHAPGTSVTVTIEHSKHDVRIRVADVGGGIPQAETQRALERKYRRDYAEPAGLTVDLSSGPNGTTVDITWSQPTPGKAPAAVAPDNVLRHALVPAVTALAWWVGASCVVGAIVGSAVVVAQPGAQPLQFVAAAAVLLVCGVVLAVSVSVARRRLPIPTWTSLLLLAPIPLLSLFTGSGVPQCGGAQAGQWAVDAALLLLMAVTLLGSSLRWTAIGAVAFVGITALVVVLDAVDLGGCVTEVTPWLAVDAAILVTIVLMRTLVTRWGEAATRDYLTVERLRVDEAVHKAHDVVRHTRLVAAIATCRPLIERLADGEADPSEPAVVRAAAVEEMYLRSMLTLGAAAAHSLLAAALARVADIARDSDVELRIATPDVPEPPSSILHDIESWLLAAVAASPGAVGEVTAFQAEDSELVLTGAMDSGWTVPDVEATASGLTTTVGVYDGWLNATFLWPDP